MKNKMLKEIPFLDEANIFTEENTFSTINVATINLIDGVINNQNIDNLIIKDKYLEISVPESGSPSISTAINAGIKIPWKVVGTTTYYKRFLLSMNGASDLQWETIGSLNIGVDEYSGQVGQLKIGNIRKDANWDSAYNHSQINHSIIIGSTTIHIGDTITVISGLSLTQPTIADFTLSNHTHSSVISGGKINYSNLLGLPTIGNGVLTLSTSGNGISGTAAFSANQTGNTTFTVVSNATASDTAGSIVLRDTNKSFSVSQINLSKIIITTAENIDGLSYISSTNLNNKLNMTLNSLSMKRVDGSNDILKLKTELVSGGWTENGGSIILSPNGSDALIIKPNSHVGINTINPVETLHVTGNAIFDNVPFDNDYNTAIIDDTATILGSSQFLSGFSGFGWRIDRNYNINGKTSAEFDNLTIRGTMRVYEMLINQIRATNGSLFVTSSAKIKDVNDLTFVVDNPSTSSSQSIPPFLVDDIILSQKTDISTNGNLVITKKLFRVLSIGTTSPYIVTVAKLNNMVLENGDEFVRIGNFSNTTRQGSIYLSSDDSYSPFIDIINGIASDTDWNTISKVKVRLGNLAGISDSLFGSLSGYGLYTTNGYFKGSVSATSGNIGGWSLNNNSLYSTNIGLISGSAAMILLGHSSNYNSAKIGLKNDGSGKLASGNINWDSTGNTTLGSTQYNHLLFSSNKIEFKNSSTILGSLSSTTWILGEDTGNNIQISSNNIEIYQSSNKIANYGSTITIGNTGNTNVYTEITNGTLKIKNSLNEYLVASSSGLSMTGSITANSGNIGGWSINGNKIFKNRVSLVSSLVNSYWDKIENNTFITGEDYNKLLEKDFSANYTGWTKDSNVLFTAPNLFKFQHQYATSGIHILRSNSTFLVGNYQTINIQISDLKYLCPIGMSELYMILSTSATITGFGDSNIKYKVWLTGVNNLANMQYEYSNQNDSVQELYIIFYAITGMANNTTYEEFDIGSIVISSYQPIVELSNSGLSIFNSPSNYLRLGHNIISNNGNTYYKSIFEFKGTSIEVQNIVVKGSLINYGTTYTAANDLIGTTSRNFIINSNGVNQASSLSFRKGTNLSNIVFDGTNLNFQPTGNNINKMSYDSSGNLTVSNSITAKIKYFQIEDKNNKDYTITYSSLEGPENAVFFRGKIECSQSEYCIELPEEWQWLVCEKSITVQLTSIGFKQKLIIKKIKDNIVTIKNCNFLFNKKINCSFIIFGERCDVPMLQVYNKKK
jgi:hypothetical protein